ncbi:MAG: hypothetical protein ACRDPO_24820 [Streptosporangiaceae bacterium]
MAFLAEPRHLVVLDGGGLVTLSGGGRRRILFSDTCAGKWSTDDCVNQRYPRIVVQNITFEDGFNGTHQATCTANAPRCWYGGAAIGWGANPAASGTPGGGSGGVIYNDGTGYSTLIAGTIMRNNSAREGGGAIFYVVDSGRGKLTLNESHLHHNPSGQFQTFPGIYDNIDGHDGPPVMIHSTDN